jgi:hypothetical protein
MVLVHRIRVVHERLKPVQPGQPSADPVGSTGEYPEIPLPFPPLSRCCRWGAGLPQGYQYLRFLEFVQHGDYLLLENFAPLLELNKEFGNGITRW